MHKHFFLLIFVLSFSGHTIGDDGLTKSLLPRARPADFKILPPQNAACPPAQPRRYVDGRTCYDESIFDNTPPPERRKKMLKRFAPIAIYLQEVTGYPASVIMAQTVKEQGWEESSPRNNHYRS